MTDEEKKVDKEIQSHLKKVYGFSDEQLLKEVESAEKSVNDLDFSGAEDRIYKRMMERRAEREKRAEIVKNAASGEPIVPIDLVAPEGPADSSESITPVKPGEENTSKENSPAKKAVRFRKKTFFLVAAVAAVLAMMLGSTAIGEKNYFFRRVDDDINHVVAVDNDKNRLDSSQIDDAYTKIAETLNIPVLKFLYIPEQMYYDQLFIEENKAVLIFNYNGNSVYYILKQKDTEASIKIESDAQDEYNIYNEWIKQDINIRENILNNGEKEYEAQIHIENMLYCITGKMEKEEFDRIIKNICFY